MKESHHLCQFLLFYIFCQAGEGREGGERYYTLLKTACLLPDMAPLTLGSTTAKKVK